MMRMPPEMMPTMPMRPRQEMSTQPQMMNPRFMSLMGAGAEGAEPLPARPIQGPPMGMPQAPMPMRRAPEGPGLMSRIGAGMRGMNTAMSARPSAGAPMGGMQALGEKLASRRAAGHGLLGFGRKKGPAALR